MRHCSLLALLPAALLPMNALAQAPAESLGRPATLLVQPEWPHKPDRASWGAVTGITVDAKDQIYLYNRSQPAVQIYRPDGSLVRAWPVENAKGAHHVKVDREGNLWLADYLRHVVRKCSPEGKVLLSLGEPGKAGSDERHFNGPTDTAVLPNGDVFVSDGYGNRRVVQFDKQGRYVKQWGQAGNGPGQFALPHAIVADSRERLYVADRNNARIQVFDAAGRLLAVWEKLITPWGLHVTKDDEIWVCGSSPAKKAEADGFQIAPPADQLVMKLSRDGKVLLRAPLPSIKTPPGKPGEVDWVHAIAVDSRGDVYLGDVQGKRAQKFRVQVR